MSSQTSSGPARKPRTMPGQSALNVVMRGLLNTPGISSGLGKRLITLYVVGRKTGKRYSIPVAYVEHDGALLIATGFGWGKNLRTGEPLEVRYKGRKRTADVEVVKDESGVVALYDVICRDNANFAKLNNVHIDASGNPDPADLRTAWQTGARVFKLTLR
ncbi:MAG TPA: nitroreductase family deazaflavin-dependent oxidoreductase [Actinospica sp.]|nr:nitroreductase family deazaflavin-dependent oxidoreductase [Actinospica sp.]